MSEGPLDATNGAQNVDLIQTNKGEMFEMPHYNLFYYLKKKSHMNSIKCL